MANEKRLDLIDRGALGIGKAKREAFNNPAYADGWNSAIAIIEQAPTVDARPVVHGRWKFDTDGDPYCSVCRKYAGLLRIESGNYCPNCGAKMDGGDGDG